MRTNHPYSVYYTVGGIAYGMSFIFAPNKKEAIACAKKDLENEGTVYDEGSLEAKREYPLYRSMIDYMVL